MKPSSPPRRYGRIFSIYVPTQAAAWESTTPLELMHRYRTPVEEASGTNTRPVLLSVTWK